jgi:hypothetical protein
MRALQEKNSRHAILRFRANAARASIALDTLPQVVQLCFPGMQLKEHRQDGYFALPNGSRIWIGGLDDKDRVEKILGLEYASVFLSRARFMLVAPTTPCRSKRPSKRRAEPRSFCARAIGGFPPQTWKRGPLRPIRAWIKKIFGTWKHNYSFRHMRWLGLAKAKPQVHLAAIAYNVKRYWRRQTA